MNTVLILLHLYTAAAAAAVALHLLRQYIDPPPTNQPTKQLPLVLVRPIFYFGLVGPARRHSSVYRRRCRRRRLIYCCGSGSGQQPT